MQLPRALTQSLLIFAVMALLGANLKARPADQTSTNKARYNQKAERLIFSRANVGFGAVNVGGQNVQTVTLTNAGDSAITLLQANGQGIDFTLTGLEFPLTLARGESFTFSVVFAPRVRGESAGSLAFVSATGGVSKRIGMNGSATEGKLVTREAAAMDFGMAPVGASGHSHSVNLRWRASSSKDVIGYNVYRGSKAAGPYRKINPVLVAATVYTDTSVMNGKAYYYVTTAVDADKEESRDSNPARAVIP